MCIPAQSGSKAKSQKKGGTKVLTMQDVAKTAEAQRRFPNWLIWMFVAMFIALWIGSMANVFPWQGVGTPAVQPGQQTQIGPAPAPQNTVPEISAPAIKEWPTVQVVWQQVTPPTAIDLVDVGSGPTPDGTAFAHKVLPELQSLGVMLVAAAKDSVDKNVVFATIGAVDDRAWQEERMRATQESREAKPTDNMFKWSFYLLLSVDGEKSWHQITLLPTTKPPVSAVRVGVKTEGGSIRFFARDTKLVESESWWGATVARSELSTP